MRAWVWDLLALAALMALAWVAFGFLLRDDLYIYGDHSGQFMRFWYPVRVSHRLLGWSPLWYAGYPELQFYLPGYVLLGWALDALTLGQLSAFGVYQLLLFLAGLLPGVSVYALVRQVTQSRGTALLTGSLALIFPVMWGGLGGLFVGMVGARLAFGLVPLVMLAGWRALHAPRPTRAWLLAALALAATALMHPFHAVAPALFLALCAASRARRGVLRSWGPLMAAVMLALGLIAFWLFPLVVRAGYAAPMLRATLDQTWAWLTDPTVLLYLGVAALAPLRLLVRRDRPVSTFAIALGGTAGLLVAFIFLDHVVLIQGLRVGLLDPVRFSAEVYLALAILAGLGLSGVPLWTARFAPARWKRLGGALGVLLASVGVFLLIQPTVAAIAPQRSRDHFLAGAQGQYPLDASWDVLAKGEGRILFTSFWLDLDGLPTTLKSMTPYFAGRAIIGGTYSHWSPIARYLWVGSAQASLLPGRIELIDDVSLGGCAWADWTDDEFLDLCQCLAVTTVVSTWDDYQARTFLDAAPHFHSAYSNDLCVIYDVLEPAPALAESEEAQVEVTRVTARAIDMHVSDAPAGASLRIKVMDYPLWRVRAGERVLPHTADAMGLMTVDLPAGSYALQVRYEPGRVEMLGNLISLGAAALWLALFGFTFHTRDKRPGG